MSKVKVYRCRICGDPYIGAEAPMQCPFCGAAQRFFVEANDWNPNEFNVKLSEISKQHYNLNLITQHFMIVQKMLLRTQEMNTVLPSLRH